MSSADSLVNRLQGKWNGACIPVFVIDTGQHRRRCMNRAKSSKSELAHLQLWLLMHLQSNIFADDRLFLPAAEPDTKFRRGYISSLWPSVH